MSGSFEPPPSQPRTYSYRLQDSQNSPNIIEIADTERGSLLSTSSHPLYWHGILYRENFHISPDGVQVDVSPPCNVDVYDVATGKKRWSVDLRTKIAGLHRKNASTFLDAPKYLSADTIAVRSEAVGWVLLSAHDGQVQRILNGIDLNSEIAALSPDGHWLAHAADNGDIKLLDIKSGQQVRVFRGHSSALSLLAFSPDSNTLVSSCNNVTDPTMRLWDVNTGREKQQWGNIYACQAAFSPDGKTLAAATINAQTQQGAVQLWDISDDVS